MHNQLLYPRGQCDDLQSRNFSVSILGFPFSLLTLRFDLYDNSNRIPKSDSNELRKGVTHSSGKETTSTLFREVVEQARESWCETEIEQAGYVARSARRPNALNVQEIWYSPVCFVHDEYLESSRISNSNSRLFPRTCTLAFLSHRNTTASEQELFQSPRSSDQDVCASFEECLLVCLK